MARLNYRSLKPEQRKKMLEGLAEVVVAIRKPKDAQFFLSRLLTQSEIVMLARRLQVAELLVGGLTYEQIQRKLGVGTTTIRDIDGWLTDAAYDYHLIRAENQSIIRSAKNRRKRKKLQESPHRESTLPHTLRHLMQYDSRMILFKLLFGDY